MTPQPTAKTVKELFEQQPVMFCIALTGAVLLFYGYIARLTGINFFWESSTTGVIAIGIAGLLFFIERIRTLKANGKEFTMEKIAIGGLLQAFALGITMFVCIARSDAYKAAQHYIVHDSEVGKDLGEVKAFSIIPIGAFTMESSNNSESASAQICITVKGTRKYRDYDVYLMKNSETNNQWQVVLIQ